MHYLLMLVLTVFLAASPLSATDPSPAGAPADVVPTVVEARAPGADAGMRLEAVRLEERASDDAMAAQLGPRGGFWWMVGVVVVAGVILAVVL